MSPPISKDLWLAAAITSTTLPTALAQPAPPAGSAPPAPAGIVAAVTPGAQIKSNDQILYVGSTALPGQRITTGKDEVLHVLLQDQSALTLGPESELVIDEFRYDDSARKGKIRLNLRQGIVRVVGGYISKNEPTEINTPHALVEISGGIASVSTSPDITQTAFLFGQQMRVSNPSGTQTVTRLGFGVTSSANTPPSSPVSSTNVIQLINQLAVQPLAAATSRQSVDSPNPAPAPSGVLISTGNTPGGTQSPGSTLANDRLRSVVDNTITTNPQWVLNNILSSGQIPNAS
ncbi:FecR domain-containing protein [Acidovorax sp. FJL06]|uniref:FecR family protein n=1 Tax=Acidovorax sp. FJL06 TaxID=2153365 RepID=UPI000F58A900|nr:FecR family protein [Acidovorax sp. FJL06]RQO80781.1 hypothetical protein DBV10_16980 [Acidovorax sp. FJL06]